MPSEQPHTGPFEQHGTTLPRYGQDRRLVTGRARQDGGEGVVWCCSVLFGANNTLRGKMHTTVLSLLNHTDAKRKVLFCEFLPIS